MKKNKLPKPAEDFINQVVKTGRITDMSSADGLKGFPEAINTIFPKTTVQLCIVHMIRNSLKYVSYKDRKELTSDLKLIYSSINEEEAILKLDLFEDKWAKKYPVIGEMWRRNWEEIIPLFESGNIGLSLS